MAKTPVQALMQIIYSEMYTEDSAGATRAATQLARRMGYQTTTELVQVLYPEGNPTARSFNVCADAIHCLTEEAL